MINYISGLVFVVLLIVGAVVLVPVGMETPAIAAALGGGWLIADIIVASAIHVAAQWEKGVVFRLGRFSSVKGPGLFFIIPLIDQVKLVDTRIRAMDIPAQQVITRDNVPVKINGVIFFRVEQVQDAIIKIQDYRYAISQYAQTSLRDVVGQMSLDQLLGEREEISKSIETAVERDTSGWGLE